MSKRLIQDLHAGISRRDWSAVENAANRLRDEVEKTVNILAGVGIVSLPNDYPLSQLASETHRHVKGEPDAWRWRSRIKGGGWDAWENGRYAQNAPLGMEVEEQALYAGIPFTPESSSATPDDERFAFEEWAGAEGYSIATRFFVEGNNYIDPVTYVAYDAWIARSGQIEGGGSAFHNAPTSSPSGLLGQEPEPSKASYDQTAREDNPLHEAIVWCLERDSRNGSLPEPYAAKLRAAIGPKRCERCQGNGEIVTDWDQYLHPTSGDEAVAECPDCDGGRHNE